MELAGENGDSEAPLIDLSSDPETESPPSSQSKKMDTVRDVGRKVTDFKYVNPHKMAHESLEKVLPVKQSNSLPLNSKDGNLYGGLEVGFYRSRKIFEGESPNEFGAAGHTPKLSHYSGANSKGNGLQTNYDFRRVYWPLSSYKNRENIMPCFGEPGDNVVKWNEYFPPFGHNQLTGTLNQLRSSQGCERGQERYQGGIHNPISSSTEARPQSTCQSHVKSGNQRNFGLDGRPWVGKVYPCFNSKATISKQGPDLRICIDVSRKPFINSCYHKSEDVDGRDRRPNNHTKMFNLHRHGQGEALMKTDFLRDLKHDRANPGEGYIAGGFACAGEGSDEHRIASQALAATALGDVRINGISPSDISQGVNLRNQEDDLNCGHPNNLSYRGGRELSYNYAYRETETGRGSSVYRSGVYARDDRSASALNPSPHNLSLETCSNFQQSASSSARMDKSQSLQTPHSNDLDLMDEEPLQSGPKVEESSKTCSNSSSEKASRMSKEDDEKQEAQQDTGANLSIHEKDENQMTTECSKANNGTLPADVYPYSATRDLQNIRNSDLECIKELGSGTFGTVYYGQWKGSNVAIKRINPSCFTNDPKKEDQLVADFWKEAHILGQLRHPNIVALYGVASDGPLNSLATVTEYMVNGSLKQVLLRKDRTIDRRKRLIIAMDATCGMEYLHEKKIVHFDLKSHNLLMNTRDPHRPVCKIGDLGLSKIKQQTLVSGGVRGTLPWMAPELLNGSNLVSEKVDVYSFGIVMWELLTCEEPYENMRSEEIIAGIIRGDLRPEVPGWCDPAWRSLMERCWSSDPDSRPAFSEIAKGLRAMSASINIK